jgi:hypothetical protein
MTAWTSISDVVADTPINATWGNSIRDNGLHLYELIGATGTALGTYTPTFAGAAITVGNGTASGSYLRLGKLIVWRARFVFGSTSAMTSDVLTVTLPVTAIATVPAGMSSNRFLDASTGTYYPAYLVYGTTTGTIYESDDPGNAIGMNQVSSTSPMTWTTSDEIQIFGLYEAA